jgi:hypothetical protein
MMEHPKDFCPDCLLKDVQIRRLDRKLEKARREAERKHNELLGLFLRITPSGL